MLQFEMRLTGLGHKQHAEVERVPDAVLVAHVPCKSCRVHVRT